MRCQRVQVESGDHLRAVRRMRDEATCPKRAERAAAVVIPEATVTSKHLSEDLKRVMKRKRMLLLWAPRTKKRIVSSAAGER